MDSAAFVVAKLVTLTNAATDYWINATAVAGSGCELDTSIVITVNPCGQEIGSNLTYLIWVFVNYIMPPFVDVVHGLSMVV